MEKLTLHKLGYYYLLEKIKELVRMVFKKQENLQKVLFWALIFYLQPTTSLDPEVRRILGFQVHCNDFWSNVLDNKKALKSCPAKIPARSRC